jgi:hypothetical protein
LYECPFFGFFLRFVLLFVLDRLVGVVWDPYLLLHPACTPREKGMEAGCNSTNIPSRLKCNIVLLQSTGWPGVVAVMGNWFGKKNRGLFLGIWNAHTSVGNILGTVVPSIWAVPGQPWYDSNLSVLIIQ